MRCARAGLLVLAASALFVGAACDEAEEAVEEVEEKAGEAGARANAEGFRASLQADQVEDEPGGARGMGALQDAADDLPGDPDVIGIVDANGDGIDDDGYVQFVVGDESACVTLPSSGDEIDVTGGACPTA
jgi:hypothetical protein